MKRKRKTVYGITPGYTMKVLKALADSNHPLRYGELKELTGYCHWTLTAVLDKLLPTFISKSGKRGRGGTSYKITAKGRKALPASFELFEKEKVRKRKSKKVGKPDAST